ncbi:hypothetical protein K2173_025747 [Erythroxylum novogranatense]|uniref:Uncharacterized protein n=1 Tax=Erythroxylum novogranatense TaxID=1862640 RepID=A0AAV8T438_9ROSI|nr:hypothetical protein K2173_025747 [Erythroxylum novogranatense]
MVPEVLATLIKETPFFLPVYKSYDLKTPGQDLLDDSRSTYSFRCVALRLDRKVAGRGVLSWNYTNLSVCVSAF